MDKGFAIFIFGMRLARYDKLYRSVDIGQYTNETFFIMKDQVWPFILRKSSAKRHSQRIGVEYGRGFMNKLCPGALLL